LPISREEQRPGVAINRERGRPVPLEPFISVPKRTPQIWSFSMDRYCLLDADVFPAASITEASDVNVSGLAVAAEEVSLIESFRQPFPTRERRSPVMNGDMDSYG
jgi:hypothetical protein